MRTLIGKLLRDIRVPLLAACLLLALFEGLWCKITDRISAQLLPMLLWLAAGRGVTMQQVEETIFAGPGRVTRALMGGENVSLFQVTDMLSVGFVHPFVQTVICLWAVGRAASAIAGELDRGTMELLLSQPIARWKVIVAHFCLDLIVIPTLCLSMWVGLRLGIQIVGLRQLTGPITAGTPIDEAHFGSGLLNIAALMFALSGMTLWFSSMGRLRGRVLGAAVLFTLVQYLVNVVGQLWDAVEPFRAWTVFYYFQPQQVILHHRWTVAVRPLWNSQTTISLNVLVVLGTVGLLGYVLALATFTRRDLPAPL